MDVLVIPVNQLPAIFLCVSAIWIGWDRTGQPFYNWLKGKPFDFIEAVASLTVGMVFMVIGFAALLFVLAHLY